MAKPFEPGQTFPIEGKIWTIRDAEHTKSDGSWYVLEAPDEDDILIKSQAELEAAAA